AELHGPTWSRRAYPEKCGPQHTYSKDRARPSLRPARCSVGAPRAGKRLLRIGEESREATASPLQPLHHIQELRAPSIAIARYIGTAPARDLQAITLASEGRDHSGLIEASAIAHPLEFDFC